MQQAKMSLISLLIWIEEGLRAYVTNDPHSDVIPDNFEITPVLGKIYNTR
jgi:hypothetical protein